MSPRSRRTAPRRAFTLVELLTVIAIIAVLAGLLLPVMATAREGMRKTTCSSNMQAILQAVKMYKEDWKVYPDALYGVMNNQTGQFVTRLFPEYVKDGQTFTCPNSPVKYVNTNPPPVDIPFNYMTGAA